MIKECIRCGSTNLLKGKGICEECVYVIERQNMDKALCWSYHSRNDIIKNTINVYNQKVILWD